MVSNKVALIRLVLALGFAGIVTGTVLAQPAWQERVDPSLLAATTGDQEAEFLVVLREQVAPESLAATGTKARRGAAVYEALTRVALTSQAPLRAELDRLGVAYRPYWVRNMIWVRGSRETLRRVASRAEVDHVYANKWLRGASPSPAERANESPSGIEWNIEHVRAPDVWAQGASGQGTVIGGQDTGYDWEHPALMGQYRGWDGAAAAHDYNWHDAIHGDNPSTPPGNPCGYDSPVPCDDDGHGTHTIGTMVGDDGQQNRIGMAPGARWIGCRNMEQGWGSPATYSECYEWFIAPYPFNGDPFTDGRPDLAPHVINNSWSCPTSEGCTAAEVLLPVVEAVRAAGIVTVHSAGNSGSSCSSVTTPAAIYDASFTVGATDQGDNIVGFSARGPVLVDGSGRLKPDITAPGSGIRSSLPDGNYGSLSGTSMSAPHVAGLIGLLVSSNPALAGDVDALESAVTQSAVTLTSTQNCGNDNPDSVPNNVYGWGRIDALSAYDLVRPEFPHAVFVPLFTWNAD